MNLLPWVQKRMLLPWFSADFCAKFPPKTDLGPWPLANTCILLFRPYWAVAGTRYQCCSSWFTAGVGGSLLASASLEPVPTSPRACGALHHHQASSCLSCSASFNHREGGRELFPAFREMFHGTRKGLLVFFWRTFWFPGKFSFLKSKWITHAIPPRNPTWGVEVWENWGFG